MLPVLEVGGQLQGGGFAGQSSQRRAARRGRGAAPHARCRQSNWYLGVSQISTDTVSEWLRRWTRNPLGSARRGSNPLGVVVESHHRLALGERPAIVVSKLLLAQHAQLGSDAP